MILFPSQPFKVEFSCAGAETGGLYTLQCQAGLQRYACVRAHEGRVHDMCAIGDGVLSLSSGRVRHHTAGGMCKLTYMDPTVSLQPYQCTEADFNMLSDVMCIACSQAGVAFVHLYAPLHLYAALHVSQAQICRNP